MVADIFYPILTLKITVLACFIQKKLGASPPTRASPWTPWWVYSSPHTPSCKKNDAPIFFLDYPLTIETRSRCFPVNFAKLLGTSLL